VHFYGNPSPPLVEKSFGERYHGAIELCTCLQQKKTSWRSFVDETKITREDLATEEKRKEKKQKGSQGKLADGENLDKNRRLAIPPRF
jgi:hypothetical protein